MMASSVSLSSLSACVTRILSLEGFPQELKTKDIQAAFSDWEGINGGFKIKWLNDTGLLVVFNDPVIAKRAYLHIIAFPPAVFSSPTSDSSFTIKPYDGPDAQAVIAAVNSRSGPGGGGHRARASISGALNGHNRAASRAYGGNGNGNGNGGHHHHTYTQTSNNIQIPTSVSSHREPSPTLPNIPNHPTLNSLISSGLSSSDIATGLDTELTDGSAATGAAPKVGDPARRMVGAALGVRHPALAPRSVSVGGADKAVAEVQSAIAGLAV